MDKQNHISKARLKVVNCAASTEHVLSLVGLPWCN